MSSVRGVIFVGLNVLVVGAYCYAMIGRIEPLKHEPVRFVIVPLMVITAVVSWKIFAFLRRQQNRWIRILMLYLGFNVISAIYGAYLWLIFPDGGPWAVPLALVGGHLYGWPVFLMVLVAQLAFGRLLFPDQETKTAVAQ